MPIPFRPEGRATLIGSMPMIDHEQAADLVFKYTPDIPTWTQLPAFPQESMVAQFAPGMPAVVLEGSLASIDTDRQDLEEELAAFYEALMAVENGEAELQGSRFGLAPEHARGFFILQQRLQRQAFQTAAVKGQVTGPVTFATSVHDANGAAIFYDAQLRDAAVKLLAMKAKWQVAALSQFERPVILFADEPALAGYGTSEFIAISRTEVLEVLGEVVGAVQAAGGLCGIHVCANTDWALVLESGVDIVNFDAFSFFDRFMLYPEAISRFLDRGGMLAWGIVPTQRSEDIRAATIERLSDHWEACVRQVEGLGFSRSRILDQSLVTPSCGVGALKTDLAVRVLQLTDQVSRRIRGNA